MENRSFKRLKTVIVRFCTALIGDDNIVQVVGEQRHVIVIDMSLTATVIHPAFPIYYSDISTK